MNSEQAMRMRRESLATYLRGHSSENVCSGPRGKPTLRADEWRDYAWMQAPRLFEKAKPSHLRRREMHAPQNLSIEPPQEQLDGKHPSEALADLIKFYQPLPWGEPLELPDPSRRTGYPQPV